MANTVIINIIVMYAGSIKLFWVFALTTSSSSSSRTTSHGFNISFGVVIGRMRKVYLFDVVVCGDKLSPDCHHRIITLTG